MLVRLFFFFLVQCTKTIDQLLRSARKEQQGENTVGWKEQRGGEEGEKRLGPHNLRSPGTLLPASSSVGLSGIQRSVCVSPSPTGGMPH